jgi:hypothetical protein
MQNYFGSFCTFGKRNFVLPQATCGSQKNNFFLSMRGIQSSSTFFRSSNFSIQNSNTSFLRAAPEEKKKGGKKGKEKAKKVTS